MHDPTLEAEFKAEIKRQGEKWVSYKSYPDSLRREVLEKMQNRRKQSEEFEAIRLKNLADECDDIYVPEVSAGRSPFQHDCGGGRRNIRSARGLS